MSTFVCRLGKKRSLFLSHRAEKGKKRFVVGETHQVGRSEEEEFLSQRSQLVRKSFIFSSLKSQWDEEKKEKKKRNGPFRDGSKYCCSSLDVKWVTQLDSSERDFQLLENEDRQILLRRDQILMIWTTPFEQWLNSRKHLDPLSMFRDSVDRNTTALKSNTCCQPGVGMDSNPIYLIWINSKLVFHYASNVDEK
jgi:hypothetical protein